MKELSQEQLDGLVEYIKDYCKEGNAADSSKRDANANVTNKNVATLRDELWKDYNIQVQRELMKRKLNERGNVDPSQMFEDLHKHRIYFHDETAGVYPYCASVSMYPFLINGTKDLGGTSEAPKHLDSFCGSFINLVFALGSQFAGACLSKDQIVVVRDKGKILAKPISELDQFNLLNNSFRNNGSIWEYYKTKDLEVWENGRFVNVKKVYRRDYSKQLYKVTTASGKKLEVTKDHRFKVRFRDRDFEVKAEDLRVGDTVYNTEYIDIPISKDGDDYKRGQLIGIIAGDGSITNEYEVRVSVNYNHDMIWKKVQELIYYFYDTSIRLCEGNKCYDLRLSNKEINKDIKSYFEGDIHNSYNKYIDLNKYSLDFLCGFLDGLTATDGSFSKSHVISLANKRLVENVKGILERLNTFKDIRSYQDNRGNRKEMYSITFPKYLDSYLDLTRSRREGNKTYDECRGTRNYYYGNRAWKHAVGMKNDYASFSCGNRKEKLYTDAVSKIETEDYSDYVYEFETESSWYSVGGIITHNCSTPELLLYLDYFCRKDMGDYYLNDKKCCKKLDNCLQQILYSINHPAAARNYQAVFWNAALFDTNYMESLFENFYFPDGTAPDFQSLMKLQEYFMSWFNKERERSLLTFPVISLSMLTDGTDVVDQYTLEWAAKEASEGNSFFVYESDSVDSLSSCCFSGDQEILLKDSKGVYKKTFKELYFRGNNFKNLTFYHDGSWCKAKKIRIPYNHNTKMYEIVTENNKRLVVTDNHIHPTLNGLKESKDICKEDYILFSSNNLDSFHEKDNLLTYEEGLLIGAYLGDGSTYERENCNSLEITLSLNSDKVSKLSKVLEKFNLYDGANNVVFAKSSDKDIYKFISSFVKGTHSYNKRLDLKCLLECKAFREGILDGYYITDGGNSNRIYSTSSELIYDMETLITSLGKHSVINISDRTDEVTYIRGEEIKHNFPLYCIRWYNPKNKRSMDNLFKIVNSQCFFKVKSVNEIEYDQDYVYCLEMENKDEQFFTLPNGVITHNCRLRNEYTDNTFSYTLGAGGIATGSMHVITTLLPMLVEESGRDEDQFLSILKDTVDNIHEYHMAYYELLKERLDAGMLPAYSAGFISMQKQFLTLGVHGLVEAAELLGYDVNNNENYKDFCTRVLSIFYTKNKLAKEKYGVMFNTEMVPAENLGVKTAKWHKEAYGSSNRECYSSYFYKPEDWKTDMIDKFVLHGSDNLKFLDGGSALHLNLEEHPTKEGYKALFRLAAQTGCSYWTTNVKSTVCKDCGYIDKVTRNSCDKCNSENITHATRIIGYLKEIDNFSEGRRNEEKLRVYHEKQAPERY